LIIALPLVHLVCWRCTYTFFLWITPKSFSFTGLGCRCSHCTTWLRLWLW